MAAARLQVPVVPVRLEGLDRILHQKWKFPQRGTARVAFGRPMRLEGMTTPTWPGQWKRQFGMHHAAGGGVSAGPSNWKLATSKVRAVAAAAGTAEPPARIMSSLRREIRVYGTIFD